MRIQELCKQLEKVGKSLLGKNREIDEMESEKIGFEEKLNEMKVLEAYVQVLVEKKHDLEMWKDEKIRKMECVKEELQGKIDENQSLLEKLEVAEKNREKQEIETLGLQERFQTLDQENRELLEANELLKKTPKKLAMNCGPN